MAAIAVTLGGADVPARAVSRINVRRGRSDELDRVVTGTASVFLNITDLHVNPITADPTGGVATVALRNPVTGAVPSIFEGLVDDLDYQVENRRVTRVEAKLVDGLDQIARVELAPAAYGDPNPPFGYSVPKAQAGQIFYEDSGQVQFRIDKVLDECRWPLGKRDIFSGNVSLQEILYPARTSALQVIHDAADAEFPGIANFFVAKDGVARFKGRLARFNPDNPVYDVLTFPAGVGSSSEAKITGLTVSRGRSRLINAALFYPRGAPDHRLVDQIYVDEPSIDQYGVYSESGEELLTEIGYLGVPNRTALEETYLFGKYYVDNFKQPRTRCDRLVIESVRSSDDRAGPTWDLLTNVDISHRIYLQISGLQGVSFAEHFYVEGLDYEIRPLQGGEWAYVSLSLDLSPAAYYNVFPF